MSWNYRVLRHEDGRLAVHEVFYDEAGRPRSHTARPVCFSVEAEEGVTALVRSLLRAARNARTLPVLARGDFEGA